MDTPENHIETLNQLCKKYNGDKMYIFGSALKEDFSDQIKK
ncbi:hypothetical protein [Autumnicola musiva]|uniref:Uncharacterized protein n=1 Tax=Autumnicola musiva TaxID=3075589 RepID=A0ABU3D0Y7_9FLAO|nr:hypothetical protein [Zunongwangia sp. F117]MDT0675196.1 hypothetical protein [Zunongwangia sp. F117]